MGKKKKSSLDVLLTPVKLGEDVTKTLLGVAKGTTKAGLDVPKRVANPRKKR